VSSSPTVGTIFIGPLTQWLEHLPYKRVIQVQLLVGRPKKRIIGVVVNMSPCHGEDHWFKNPARGTKIIYNSSTHSWKQRKLRTGLQVKSLNAYI
jgi:hypothetical protein